MIEKYQDFYVNDMYISGEGNVYRGDKINWLELEYAVGGSMHFVRFQISIKDAEELGFIFEYKKNKEWKCSNIQSFKRKANNIIWN